MRQRSRPQRSLCGLIILALLAASCATEFPSLSGDTTASSTLPTNPSTRLAPTSTTPTTVAATSTSVIPPLDATFEAIATKTTMTDEARSLLALSNPRLVDRDTLGSTCTLDPESSVLGCYRSGEIAVLAVVDPLLDGTTEATTAHEMLHAAWATIDDAERERLTLLLWASFDRAATPTLSARIDAYRARDPSVVDNELHSILGTEVADLEPELEAYYRRWFVDRSAVVSLAVAARATLISLEAQVKDLDARLSDLGSRVESEEAALKNDRTALEARSAELEALRAGGQVDEFNAAVDEFNELVRIYNEAVSALDSLIAEHNALVSERNALAAAYTDLVAQITTSVESLPST